MLRLLRIDLQKMRYYRTFWVTCGLYVLTLTITTQNKIFNTLSLYAPPRILQNISYTGSFFKIILGAIVAVSIANEFTYRTARQNIIDGLSRQEFMLSKILTNALLTLLSMLLVFLLSLPSILFYDEEITTNMLLIGLKIIIAYGIHIFAFMSIALAIGIMTRRAGLVMVFLIGLPLIESIVINIIQWPDYLAPYFPIQAIEKLVNISFLAQDNPYQLPVDGINFPVISIVLVWTVIFNYTGYLWLKKRPL